MLESAEKSDEQVEILLSDALELYGYDFTGYSRASLKRRILRLYALDKFVSFAEFRYKLRSELGILIGLWSRLLLTLRKCSGILNSINR